MTVTDTASPTGKDPPVFLTSSGVAIAWVVALIVTPD
ncbi:MAG: hypothetical protein QOK02_584 [Mycobacterium sp.]|jgi:hypothetical protein|nr:hypothetical protein [Mycobacterium sp.]